jgi:hypothetical protein
VREEERYPDIPGEAAIDGTGSHLLLELCLQNNVQAAQYDQQIIGTNHPDNINGWLVAPDRIKRVQMCLDYVTRRIAELKAAFPGCTVTVEAEQKSDPGGAFGRDDWWGTVDITIIARHAMTSEMYFIEVIDYKDGRGYVSEKKNTQLISYLFGKMRAYVASGPDLVRPFRPEKVPGCRVTIVQPKTNPVIRYRCSTQPDHGFDSRTVVEAAEGLAAAAYATDKADAPLVSGKHCQWCKANPKRGGHCTAESNQSLQTVESMSTEIITKDQNLFEYISKAIADPKSLSVEQLAELADAEDGILAVFGKVKDEIQTRIEQEIHVPGYAMQPGRGSNVYSVDDKTVTKKLKACRLKQDDIFPPKLISPAQMMKLDNLTDKQKERLEKEIITFKAGKLKLTKVSRDHQSEKVVAQSPTDGLQSDAELMFAGVPKQDEVPASATEEISFF